MFSQALISDTHLLYSRIRFAITVGPAQTAGPAALVVMFLVMLCSKAELAQLLALVRGQQHLAALHASATSPILVSCGCIALCIVNVARLLLCAVAALAALAVVDGGSWLSLFTSAARFVAAGRLSCQGARTTSGL